MRPLNIFHIDDSDDDALLFSRALRQAQQSAALKWFPSGREAVVYLEAASVTDFPDLIFCDLKMPGMTGHDFIRWLRQSQWQAVPVIALSGSDMVEDIRTAYEIGVNSFLNKPLSTVGILNVFRDEYMTLLDGSTAPPLSCRDRSDDDQFWNWYERVTETARLNHAINFAF